MPVIDTDNPGAVDPATLPHDSLKNGAIACSVVCVVIATVFVALRLYTRVKIVKVVAPTDWLLLAALIVSYVLSVASILESVHGLGSHIWDYDVAAHFSHLQKSGWIAILFYLVSLYLIKMSFLLLYLHIFTYTRARIIIYAVMALVVFSALWSIIITLTACVPLEAFWNPAKAAGAYCHSPTMFWVNTGLHVVTDYLIFAVPLPKIWTMKMPKRQKALLIGLFSLGFIVCFISIIRVIFLAKLHRLKDPDWSYAGTDLTFLSVVEVNAAIVVACCITLKPLANRYFPNWLRSPSKGGNAGFTQEKPPTIGGTGPAGSGDSKPKERWSTLEEGVSSSDAEFRKESEVGSNTASSSA